ncbi:MAG: AAA family ATPase [Opitutaceae bacterium]|jgi:predicted ATP-binding protein involved in virulence|nr:AAA family ATPase [Opitutaceae bacterium]
MYLQKITLRDFRCFDSLTIDLHPRLTVLVAGNAGGKTAVLHDNDLRVTPTRLQTSIADFEAFIADKTFHFIFRRLTA